MLIFNFLEMRKYLKYIAITALSAIVLSCDNYVDIQTEGKLVPKETQNYRYLLNNTYELDNTYGAMDVASDDISFQNEAQIVELESSTYYRPYVNIYKWADVVYFDGERDYDIEAM